MRGSCHCGAIAFEAPEPVGLTECNCSFCDRVGGLWAYCTVDAFRLLGDAGRVATYRFGRKLVEHRLCATCGCVTHGPSPDFADDGTPDFANQIMGYNVRMMRDLDRRSLPVKKLDGASF